MRTAPVLIALAAAACEQGPPTRIDGSSPEAFERSVEQARRDLPVADRIVYDRAIRTVGGRRLAADPRELARTTFDGMTASQIVADQKGRE